ncbi:putative kynureninase protein [Botrytis fragariae]|uniref:Kynureninase n=1 Tax=Botrytis fragariae TaxID=1964551 RepID=A0A8H6AY54_9HELO|nr:putative kynureninase protein [Botrytis fragariae]KAF5875630.1 putative kynureninase protein [Botrytis fragariae]
MASPENHIGHEQQDQHGQRDQHMNTREYAVSQDAQDPLRQIRNEFLIPSTADLQARTLSSLESRNSSPGDPCVYLCGNSLGLQPRTTSTRIEQYLKTWATQGVFGHFKPLSDSPLPTWLHVDSSASKNIAPIVGAEPSEVNVMQTLTANLHLLMSAFYSPDVNGRHKIILESKAFPSDHYAVESQIRHHNLSPATSMITLESGSITEPTLSTDYILKAIETHAKDTAILILPGIQFYTGQLFDIPLITRRARDLGIFVIWDLAHAVGNVPLYLHDWDVDAAAWCTYKYLNSGPGCIGGMFIHERNTQVSASSQNTDAGQGFVNRLSGWWGNDKNTRFAMENRFVPIAGAAGFQLSNPSVLDITSLNASLEIFKVAGGMEMLRVKSVELTAYLEDLLLDTAIFEKSRFSIITPRDREQRGAQLSLQLADGLLDVVMKELELRGVVVDERQPNVIRVAPAPLYNSFEDVWKFVEAFKEAMDIAWKAKLGEVSAEGTRELELTT